MSVRRVGRHHTPDLLLMPQKGLFFQVAAWASLQAASQQAAKPASQFDENGTGMKTVPKQTKKPVEECTFPAGSKKNNFPKG